MADERKIVIELKAVGGTGDGENEEENEESAIEKFDKTRKKAIASAVKQVAGATVREITAQVEYDFNKYCNLSDDYKSQLMLNNSMTTVNLVMSIGSSALSGAMLGAKIGGGWGAVIGAAVTTTIDIGSKIFSYARQYDQQNLQLELGDVAARYSGSRLGLVDNGRGTQN